eukprot:COSAG06_NODE_16208_length_1013_cov_1.764770_1_plen_99_part_10
MKMTKKLKKKRSNKSKYILCLLGLSLCLSTTSYASANSPNMIRLPGAAHKYSAPLEYGFGSIFGNDNNKVSYEAECFIRMVLLKKVILNTNLSGKSMKR